MSKLRFIWDTVNQYQRLSDLLKYEYYNPTGDSSYFSAGIVPPCNGFQALQDNPLLAEKASGYLESLGISRLRYLGHGEFATVFRVVQDQVVRISVNTEESARPAHPAILQPIVSHIIEDPETPIRIEILPQIKNKGAAFTKSEEISHEEDIKLRKALEQSNLSFHDPQDQNMAKLPDGTLVVIDGGAVSLRKEKSMITQGEHLKPWIDEATGQWKQRVYCPTIKTGRLKGVFSKKSAERVSNKLGEEHPIVLMVRAGFYKCEIAYVLRKARQSFFDTLGAKTANDNDRNALTISAFQSYDIQEALGIRPSL